MGTRKAKKGGGAKSDEYDVGYGRPPRQSQFKPGESGNPKGRPKGTRNFETDVKAALQAPVKLTRDGVPQKLSTQEAALERLRAMALGGNARALDRLLALAQAYSDELPVGPADLPADDQALLELYRARLASGAAGPDGPKK